MTNEFFVGVNVTGDMVQFARHVPQHLTPDQALNLAAWIVALTDPTHEEFNRKLAEVETT